MKNNRKIISGLSLKLQSQTQIPLWSLANEKVIYSLALGEITIFGTKTHKLYQLMRIAYKLKTSDILIFLVGFFRAFSIWRRIKKIKISDSSIGVINSIFAGFGASSEEYLYANYLKESNVPSLRINWVTYDGMSEIGCPGLWSIILILFKNAFGYSAKLKNAINEISSNQQVFLTVCAANLGIYAFFRSYWQLAKSRGVHEISFLAMDMQAFAAIDENIQTIYLQHGLMKFSILIPQVHYINVLTGDEQKYLQKSLKNCNIRKEAKKTINDIKCKKDVLFIMSLNVAHTDRLKTCEPIVNWAKQMGMQIVVRPTSVVSQSELTNLLQRIPTVIVDDYETSLEDSLNRWRPKLVAAWSSTGLATALDHGCLPVSFFSPDDHEIWDDMIYPMRERVLFWSRDISVIENIIQSDSAYATYISKLQNYHENDYPDELSE